MQMDEDPSISKYVVAVRLHQCPLACFNSLDRREVERDLQGWVEKSGIK